MRANVYRRRPNHDPPPEGAGPAPPDADGPRCFFCAVNRRYLNQSLCTLGFILVIGTMAYTVSHFTNDELSFEMDEIPKLRKDFNEMQHRVDDLNKTVHHIDNNSKTPLTSLKSVSSQEVFDSHIIDLIKAELSIYDSDKTGMTDYALENLGACILSTKNTVSLEDESSALTIFGFPVWGFPSSPRVMLQPSMEPGQCWAFEGRGEVIIKLMSEVFISAISIEHISRQLSPYGDISSAPKDFELFGVKTLDDFNLHPFGSFTYSKEGPTLQMFNVQNPCSFPFGIVEIHFNSNHGNDRYTCVYRVRIHGWLPEQLKGR